MALWGARTEEFRSDRWAGGEGGATAIESNYGFPTFPTGLGGCIVNVFAKVEFKCLLVAMTGRFEFEPDRKREWLSRWGSRKPQGV